MRAGGLNPYFRCRFRAPTKGGPHRYLVCMPRLELGRLVEGHQHLKLACLPFHHMHMVCGHGIEPWSPGLQSGVSTSLTIHT